MPKFRAKIVIVNAYQFTGDLDELRKWIYSINNWFPKENIRVSIGRELAYIPDLSGELMELKKGDFLVSSDTGNSFYKISKEAFLKNYEPLAEHLS